MPRERRIWGLPVVTTGALAVDQALVVDPQYVLLLDREQATVVISSEDRDNFVKNIVTILAE
jgi:Phage capsid family